MLWPLMPRRPRAACFMNGYRGLALPLPWSGFEDQAKRWVSMLTSAVRQESAELGSRLILAQEKEGRRRDARDPCHRQRLRVSGARGTQTRDHLYSGSVPLDSRRVVCESVWSLCCEAGLCRLSSIHSLQIFAINCDSLLLSSRIRRRSAHRYTDSSLCLSSLGLHVFLASRIWRHRGRGKTSLLPDPLSLPEPPTWTTTTELRSGGGSGSDTLLPTRSVQDH